MLNAFYPHLQNFVWKFLLVYDTVVCVCVCVCVCVSFLLSTCQDQYILDQRNIAADKDTISLCKDLLLVLSTRWPRILYHQQNDVETIICPMHI